LSKKIDLNTVKSTKEIKNTIKLTYKIQNLTISNQGKIKYNSSIKI